MKKFIVVAILLVSTAAFAQPPEFTPPGHRWDRGKGGNATAEANAFAFSISNQNQTMANDWTQSLTVSPQNNQNFSVSTPDTVKIKQPIKYHGDDITPRDPSPYEGPWDPSKSAWNTEVAPWQSVVKESWTNEDVSDFPKHDVRISSGIFKPGKKSGNVTFTMPPPEKMKGIHYAGTIRFSCNEPACTPEGLHRKIVETAHAKGLAYMKEITYGVDPAKAGGDKSFRIGGGGGGMTGDGGVSGGGGIGWGDYWTAPAWMPWVIFHTWTYKVEGQ